MSQILKRLLYFILVTTSFLRSITAAPLPNTIIIQNQANDWRIQDIEVELDFDYENTDRVIHAENTLLADMSVSKTQTRVFLDLDADFTNNNVHGKHKEPRSHVRVSLDFTRAPSSWWKWKTWSHWWKIDEQGSGTLEPEPECRALNSDPGSRHLHHQYQLRQSGDTKAFDLSVPLSSSEPDVFNEGEPEATPRLTATRTRTLEVTVEYRREAARIFNLQRVGMMAKERLKLQWTMIRGVLRDLFSDVGGPYV
ncbi:hypothetical protein VKT23_007265 [Stygiomarasmius scandens]|uniref:Uncharacterized protein n=1 Tax=Marasmiellus scandens TaxID=2682957 RepID=A0ABR1JMK3_9AGAR